MRSTKAPRSPGQALVTELTAAAAMSHGDRSFAAHLIGTYQILRAWRQAPSVCAAGLLHSAYSTQSYPHALIPIEERARVRALVGVTAERLVHLFCTLDRVATWPRLIARVSGDRSRVRGWRRDGAELELPVRTARRLAMIEAANLAEQCRDEDGGPAPWMHQALAAWRAQPRPRRLAGPARQPGMPRPPGSLTAAAEEEAIEHYQRAVASAPRSAVRLLDRAIACNPWAGEPWLLRALGAASPAAARRDALHGAGLLRGWAVAWDKRLPLAGWLQLAERIERGQSADGDQRAVLTALRGAAPPPAWLTAQGERQPVVLTLAAPARQRLGRPRRPG